MIGCFLAVHENGKLRFVSRFHVISVRALVRVQMTCLRRNGSVVSSAAAAAASSSLRQLAGAGAAARVSNLSAQNVPDCGKASGGGGGGQNIMEDF